MEMILKKLKRKFDEKLISMKSKSWLKGRNRMNRNKDDKNIDVFTVYTVCTILYFMNWFVEQKHVKQED